MLPICTDIVIEYNCANVICDHGIKLSDYANKMKQGCGEN